MIRDRIGDLKNLADAAGSATREAHRDTAAADVYQRIDEAHGKIRAVGVTGFLSRLQAPTLHAVQAEARRLDQALSRLAAASDAELEAYASASPEQRGILSALQTSAQALRQTLIEAQATLLADLAERIWPNDDLSRLDAASHLTGGWDRQTTGRTAMACIHELREAAQDTVALGGAQLERMIAHADAVAEQASPLRDEAIPEPVIAFWEAAASEEGAALSDLNDDVRAWLSSHNALGAFTVHRHA